jgi:catechol 2,3-dioxygenase-like lactoylglutathione lyase family enzyme
MTVQALDHINIMTADVAGTAAFYAELLDLRIGDGPPPFPRTDMIWMYDAANRPLIHINSAARIQQLNPYPRDVTPGPSTGALHHVAFTCQGYAVMTARLEARGLAFRANAIASIGLRQLFVADPNGVLLELNFWAD